MNEEKIINLLLEIKNLLEKKTQTNVSKDLKNYLQNLKISDIIDLETRLAYSNYGKGTITMFNKAVKQQFPELKIKQITKNNKSIRVWQYI